MKKKLRVLVLFDVPNPPPENPDYAKELATPDWKAEADVINAIKTLGHELRLLGVHDDPGAIISEIKDHRPDVVFNLTEEFNRRSALDRNVPALLEMLDIRCTGNGPTGLTLCKNKGMAKEILAFHHIKSPDFAVFHPGAVIKRPKRLDFPLFIKPLKDEASYGISQDSFVEHDAAFDERVRYVHDRMKQEALAEEYIEGRELYVSILGNRRLQVLPIREVIFTKMPEDQPRFATFKAKWDETYRQRWGIENVFAENLPNGLSDRIGRICKRVYRALHLRGYGRIDLRLTPDNRIFILEANPNPNLSSDDEFAQSAMKAGYTYDALIQQIMRLAF
jgi:D-alanine-D-alanine ligase